MSYGWRDISGQTIELCDECGFDARVCGDEVSALSRAFSCLSQLSGRPSADLRPQPETWSAHEYVEHCLDVTEELLGVITTAVGRPAAERITSLDEADAGCRRVLDGLGASDRRVVIPDAYPFPVDVEWVARHLLHDLEHHVLDIRRGHAALDMAAFGEVYTVER